MAICHTSNLTHLLISTVAMAPTLIHHTPSFHPPRGHHSCLLLDILLGAVNLRLGRLDRLRNSFVRLAGLSKWCDLSTSPRGCFLSQGHRVPLSTSMNLPNAVHLAVRQKSIPNIITPFTLQFFPSPSSSKNNPIRHLEGLGIERLGPQLSALKGLHQ